MTIDTDIIQTDQIQANDNAIIDADIVMLENSEEKPEEPKKFWAEVKITDEIEEKIQKICREEMLAIQTERNEENYDYNYEYWQKYYDGKFPKTTFPLGDLSCEKHIGLASMYVDIVVLKAVKHTLSANPIILLKEKDTDIENTENTNKIYKRQELLEERLRNYIKIENLYNLIYREACIQGVAWVKATYTDDVEKAKIYKTYSPNQQGIDDFISENPDYITDKELQNKLKDLVEGKQIKSIIDKEIPIFIGIKPDLIKGQKLWVRLNDTNFRKHKLIAEEMEVRRSDIEDLAEQGFLNKKQVEKLFDNLADVNNDDEDDIKNDKLTIYENIIYCKLEKGKGKYRYIAVTEKKTNRVLRLIYYPEENQRLYFVPVYVKPKHKKTVGYSLIELSIESNDLYDSLWRALLNQIILAQKPPLGYNSEHTDTLTSKNFEAGSVTAGLSQKDVWQLNVDLPNPSMLSAIQLSGRQAEFPIGVSSGMSGQESLSDPRAPMGKTAMLLSESNMRVESYIMELQKSNSLLAELIEQGEIQYNLDNYLKFSNKKIEKDVFNIPVSYIPQALSTTINTQNDTNIVLAYLNVVAQYFPNVIQNPVFQYEISNILLNNSGGSLEKIKDTINPSMIQQAKDLAVDSIINLLKKVLSGDTSEFSPEEYSILQKMQGTQNQAPEQNANNNNSQPMPARG